MTGSIFLESAVQVRERLSARVSMAGKEPSLDLGNPGNRLEARAGEGGKLRLLKPDSHRVVVERPVPLE
jgi:hypothetical protein